MVDLPKRNPIRGGPTYVPGESLPRTIGRVVTQDLPALAGRIAGAWNAGARPATAGPPVPAAAPAAPSAGVTAPQNKPPVPAAAPAAPAPGPSTVAPSNLPPGYQGVAGRHSGPSPDLLKARKSIEDIESRGSGGSLAVGPPTKGGHRAYGAQQVKDTNIGPWTEKQTGRQFTPKEFLNRPDVQNKVFNWEFGQKAKEFGSPDKPDYAGTAGWWISGKSPKKFTGKEKDTGTGITAGTYKKKFIAGFGGVGEEKEMKELDEFKSPWAGIDKAAADTDRWRKNREEGKRAVTDAKTEKRPGWLKKTVGDYISAKYGVKKEEKVDEIAPAIEVVGWRKQFQDKDKAKAKAKEEAKKKALGFNRAKPGEHGWGFEIDKEGKKRQLSKKEAMGEEAGTQTSPGVDTEEHPKKIELPEKYAGEYSVRKIYKDGD